MNPSEMNDRVKKLEDQFEDLKEIVIGGDPDEPGVIHTVRQVVRDMYDQTKGFGVIHRVQNIESDKLRYENRVQGAAWAAKLAWALVGALAMAALYKMIGLK